MGVRWYLRYSLRYRDREALMLERGLSGDHTTMYRWVQADAPEPNRRLRPHRTTTNARWRVDETYVNVRGQWMDALSSGGRTRSDHRMLAQPDPHPHGNASLFNTRTWQHNRNSCIRSSNSSIIPSLPPTDRLPSDDR